MTKSKNSFPYQLIFIPLLVISVIITAIYLITESDRLRTYPLTSYDLSIPTDSVSISHGKHVYTIRGCVDCHGSNLGGKIIESGLLTGIITAPNLTAGEGSAIRDYSTSDLVRVIREGVKPNGKSVIMMPSHKFQVIHQRDLESLISYIRQASPLNRKLPATSLNYPVRFYYFINRKLALFPANMVKRPIEMPEPGPSSRLEKGLYIASSCVGCHGYQLEGGVIPGAPPYWPPAPDLTQRGVAGDYTEQQFKDVMQSGVTPNGRHLDERYMPWPAFGQLTNDELELLWEYMSSLN